MLTAQCKMVQCVSRGDPCSFSTLWLGSGGVSRWINSNWLTRRRFSEKKHTNWQKKAAWCIQGHRTYPKLLHFFFLQGGCHEQRSREGKGGRVEKERRQSLGQERPPRPLRRSNFTPDPRESQKWGNQMVTPLGSDNIRQGHTFHGSTVHILCQQCVKGNSCQRKQLPEGAAAWKYDADIVTGHVWTG